jgi:hypothetical protein
VLLLHQSSGGATLRVLALLTFLAAASTGVATPAADATGAAPAVPKIFDLHYGLASFAQRQVYQETALATYHENGSCGSQPCLQWGFRFGFSDVEPGAKMQCSTALTLTTQLLAFAPPSSTRTDYNWTFTFPRRAGIAFVPQYVTGLPGEKAWRDIDMKCRLDGVEVISFRFSVDSGGPAPAPAKAK